MSEFIKEGVQSRVYEIGYLIIPRVDESALPTEVATLQGIVSGQDGTIIMEEAAQLIDLAYPMYKIIDNKKIEFKQAYFGWIKFEVLPGKLDAIKTAFDTNINVLRHLIMSTVAEDTRISKTLNLSASAMEEEEVVEFSTKPKTIADMPDEPKAEVEEKPTEPIDEKELDKEIDDLVVEE